MKELVRCRACGFITAQSRVKGVCPACGVPAKNMLPYTDPVSAKRRRVLALDAHPIIDHFSEGFSVFSLVLACAALFVRGAPETYLIDTIVMLSVFMPLAVLLSFVSGVVDAKLRFRRVTTPIPKRKMILGAVFFVFTLLMLILAIQPGFAGGRLLGLYVVFNAGALVCGFFLGILGKGLLGAELPG